MIRRIRDLLYDQGFTISGARNKLQELVQHERDRRRSNEDWIDDELPADDEAIVETPSELSLSEPYSVMQGAGLQTLRKELIQIRELLSEGI